MNFGFLTLDIILILSIFFVIFFITFKKGKKSVVNLILSIILSAAIFSNFPYSIEKSDSMSVLIFVIIYSLMYLFINKIISVKKNHNSWRKIIDCIVLSASYLLLLISTYKYAVPELQSLYLFTPKTLDLIGFIDYGLMILISISVLFFASRNSD